MNVSKALPPTFTSHLTTAESRINNAWFYIYDNYTPSQIEFWGSQIVQIIAFWIPATIYVLIDVLAPKFSARHKLQQNKRQPTGRDILQAAGGSLRNNLIVAALLFAKMKLLPDNTLYTVTPELPSLKTIAWQFLWAITVREIIFYYVHRSFHHPLLYPKIHKKHHKYTIPVAYAAEYCTITEHLCANMLPIILGHIIIKAHYVSAMIYVAHELYQAAADHSGYDFFKLPHPTKFHDLHHEKFRLYYSPLGVMDWLHGTNKLPEKQGKKAQ